MIRSGPKTLDDATAQLELLLVLTVKMDSRGVVRLALIVEDGTLGRWELHIGDVVAISRAKRIFQQSVNERQYLVPNVFKASAEPLRHLVRRCLLSRLEFWESVHLCPPVIQHLPFSSRSSVHRVQMTAGR